jgi:hypothetical protein
MDDAEKWEGSSNGTAYTIDTRKAAMSLRNRLTRTKKNGYYAVFYDPMKVPQSDKEYLQSREEARQQLRKQVQDFVKWLKGQGVI